MPSVEKVFDDTTEYVADTAIGAKAATRGFQIRLDTSKACKVNVLTKVGGKPTPVFRLDAAHGGHPGAGVPHININPKVSGLRADPHLPIPGGQTGLQVSFNILRGQTFSSLHWPILFCFVRFPHNGVYFLWFIFNCTLTQYGHSF